MYIYKQTFSKILINIAYTHLKTDTARKETILQYIHQERESV